MKTKKISKSQGIVSEFFTPYFEKHPQMNRIWFLIYNHDGEICLSQEDFGINEFRWDELSDAKMYDASYKVQSAISLLKLSGADVANIIVELDAIVSKLQNYADDGNPLNKTLESVWNDDTVEKLSKKISKSLSKEIPWKYVHWCQCNVNRDGTVEIEEHQ